MPTTLTTARAATPPRILERIAAITPYEVDRPPQPIDLWLDANEGAACDAAALDAIRTIDADALRRYPDASELESLVASQLGIDTSRVLATAGGDDAIDRLCRATLDESRTLVTHTPGFSMIPISARKAGARVVGVRWERGPFPTDAFLASITDDTGLVALVTPNNPTGSSIPFDDVRAVADRCAQVGALLLLDLAYTEFGERDFTPDAITLPNTAIVRTLSKAWGMAGCRVGFLLANPPVVRACRAAGNPFSASAPSVAAASAALRDRPITTTDHPAAALVKLERRTITEALASLRVDALESDANFVLARTPRSLWVRDALRSAGIAVRAWPGSRDLTDALRITCPGSDDALRRLTRALAAALSPQALLLDMDGVIADVSRSYRAAILATCASFGVEATPADVAAIKARGDANNDWRVTHEILASRDVDVPYELVVERFEAIYQGTPQRPGLRETEALIGSADTLRALAERVPLAIVTGRPRADAERFLDRFGLTPLFPVVVCMEDGPSKPDPAILDLATQRLGVERAWMVGDTVDDIRAAKRASRTVIPIGVVAPQDDPAPTAASLLRSGASRVVDSLADLSEILP